MDANIAVPSSGGGTGLPESIDDDLAALLLHPAAYQHEAAYERARARVERIRSALAEKDAEIASWKSVAQTAEAERDIGEADLDAALDREQSARDDTLDEAATIAMAQQGEDVGTWNGACATIASKLRALKSGSPND